MVWTCPMQVTKLVRKSFSMHVNGPPKRKDTFKRKWMKVITINQEKCNLSVDLTQD